LEAPDLTLSEWLAQMWADGGFMMWPLGASAVIGAVVIIWKLVDMSAKTIRTRKVLREVDTLMTQRKLNEALQVARESNTPAGRILVAGLERREEGSDRVIKA